MGKWGSFYTHTSILIILIFIKFSATLLSSYTRLTRAFDSHKCIFKKEGETQDWEKIWTFNFLPKKSNIQYYHTSCHSLIEFTQTGEVLDYVFLTCISVEDLIMSPLLA